MKTVTFIPTFATGVTVSILSLLGIYGGLGQRNRKNSRYRGAFVLR